MAKIPLPDTLDEREFRQYTTYRDAPRNAIAFGVYPNILACLSSYGALGAALSGDLSDVAEYHEQITAPVAPYIEQLQQHMAAIAQIVEAIEKAAPGTFGIALPQAEESE